MKMSPWNSLRILGVVLFLGGCATPEVAVNSRADFSKIHRVAVATFGGPGGDVGADLLTQDLLRHGADVVERQRLDALIHEQDMGTNGVLDPKTMKKIGKVLGVDAIFLGTIANNVPSQSYLIPRSRRGGYGYESTPVPIAGGNVTAGPATGIPRTDIVTSAAQAAIIARMVDVETGSILWSGRMSYEGYDTQSAMASVTGSFAKSLVPLWPALHP
jgi:hypothetical protein